MTEHVGASWEESRAEHGEPLVIEGTLAVWTDGSVRSTSATGRCARSAAWSADYFEARPDPMGDRFVGRVSLRVDRLATPAPPPGWNGPAGEVDTEWKRVRHLERRLGELQGILEPMLASPRVDGPDGRYCVFCGEIGEHADDCEVLRRDELLHQG